MLQISAVSWPPYILYKTGILIQNNGAYSSLKARLRIMQVREQQVGILCILYSNAQSGTNKYAFRENTDQT